MGAPLQTDPFPISARHNLYRTPQQGINTDAASAEPMGRPQQPLTSLAATTTHPGMMAAATATTPHVHPSAVPLDAVSAAFVPLVGWGWVTGTGTTVVFGLHGQKLLLDRHVSTLHVTECSGAVSRINLRSKLTAQSQQLINRVILVVNALRAL